MPPIEPLVPVEAVTSTDCDPLPMVQPVVSE